jgi:hypothetical protein
MERREVRVYSPFLELCALLLTEDKTNIFKEGNR